MSIRSGWNSDRIAAARMARKLPPPRRIYKRPAEYGSVFVKLPLRAAAAAAVCAENVAHGQKVDQRVKFIAENSAMDPQGGALGHGSRFASEIPKHIQWLAALAADFAAMSAEAAVSAPEYAEEYSLIAQAAAYEIKVLTPDDGWH